MVRSEVANIQMEIVRNKIHQAKEKGISQIVVSPILEENTNLIRKEGNNIVRAKLLGEEIALDVISWEREYEPKDMENLESCVSPQLKIIEVSPEVFNTILNMKEM